MTPTEISRSSTLAPISPSPWLPLGRTWPRCGAEDGCTERACIPYPACLAHLTPDELERMLAGLNPGADIDLRGSTVPERVFAALLKAVTGPDKHPHLGRSRFDGAVLPAGASLSGVCFEGDCSFDGARFDGGVSFYDARFLGHVSFRGARFAGNASFHGARFQRHGSFDEAVFACDALFGETVWRADASFSRTVFVGAVAFDRAHFGRDAVLEAAQFGGAASFRRVRVARHARLDRTRFRQDVWMGPLATRGRLSLTYAKAHRGLRVDAVARQVDANHVVAHGPAEFRLRHADLDLEDAYFHAGVTVRSLSRRFQCLTEDDFDGRHGPVRLLSARGLSAPKLELADVDLSRCKLLGLEHPEGLRITGDCTFATLPARRRVRGLRGRQSPRDRQGCAVLVEELAGSYGGLAVLYRHLAAAAAEADPDLARDLRYRSFEVRRRADPRTVRRWLLHLSWLMCGYGLRTGRLTTCMAVLVVLLASGAAYAARP
ncbi:pentapeptide repeat-containing protein [Actinomadura rugatobispora]|uniref:Pentapeptide repeat-containing protein n=1 Tax=Actinomadura rugatobispora TaxID=1994 RepID=A0ABW1AJ50_9ACTN|nr:hypothetical protein GCM10010200_047100 [Actinomadura rugatobispora]